ncbi:hypothetical protein NDU88_006804 [Pleurodeles waltl]|uniref:Uncharacterized protein n=1 Tax=Pleurodeles waltl TaxID=8319 RepID=A0AAV7UP57_PLEWA|nr:hypothetical protein NDU88_006804 [Pleurodeles waltl]
MVGPRSLKKTPQSGICLRSHWRKKWTSNRRSPSQCPQLQRATPQEQPMGLSLTKEINELGNRVSGLERTGDAQGEELDSHRYEILVLQDKNAELRYQV